MTKSRQNRLSKFWPALALGLACLIPTSLVKAQVQTYPTKPIRLITPYAAGGATDVYSRLLATELTKLLGQAVIVDNRSGAGGMVGTEAVVNAAPDGYTLCYCTSGPMAVAKAIDPTIKFDPNRDLIPVAHVVNGPNFILARTTLGVESLKDVLAMAKNRSTPVTVGTPGAGLPHHLALEMLKLSTNSQFVHVPYRGEQPSINDLMAGHIDLVISSSDAATQALKTGKVKAIAVMSEARASQLPDVPTASETIPGLTSYSFHGVNAPRGTPPEIVKKLSDAVVTAMKSPVIQERIRAQSATPIGGNAQQYAEFLDKEQKKYVALIKKTGTDIFKN